MFENPFVIGQGYHRVDELHPLIGGGNPQSGIIFGEDLPVVVITTTPSGKRHGYLDGSGDGFFTYYGQGRSGDHSMTRGNLAVLTHAQHGKPLLWFRQERKGGPYTYDGEFVCDGFFWDHESIGEDGVVRSAIVFRVVRVDGALSQQPKSSQDDGLDSLLDIGATETKRLSAVRSKQQLFRARLLSRESMCRITGISDQRFLRASHIKPWSKCDSAAERLDPNNGLLLATHADHLFDNGWITFDESGCLMVSQDLPIEVADMFGGALKAGRPCGSFTEAQQKYLKHHRENEFEQAYRRRKAIIDQLASHD